MPLTKKSHITFNSFVLAGLYSGITWGLFALFISKISGAFLFEKTYLQNFLAFTFGGLAFGIAFTSLISLFYNIVPTKDPVLKCTISSLVIWSLLKVGGLILQLTGDKYTHTTTLQNFQGLFLLLSLGVLTGIYLKILTKPKDNPASLIK